MSSRIARRMLAVSCLGSIAVIAVAGCGGSSSDSSSSPDGGGSLTLYSSHGHDATARIEIEGADHREIVARVSGHTLPAVGEQVAIAVEGTALSFPAGPAGRQSQA